MPKVKLPIAKGYYRTGSKPISDQNCVNLYPVIEDRPSLVREYLRGIPGVTLVAADDANPEFDPLDPASEGIHNTDAPTPPDPDSQPDDPDAPQPDLDEDSNQDRISDGERPLFPECEPYACDAMVAGIPGWAQFITASDPAYSDVFPTSGANSLALNFYQNETDYGNNAPQTDWTGAGNEPIPLSLSDAVGIAPPINVCSATDVHVLRRNDGSPASLFGISGSPNTLPGQSSQQLLMATGARGPAIDQSLDVYRVETFHDVIRDDTQAIRFTANSSITVSSAQLRGSPGALTISIAVNGANYDETDTYSATTRTETLVISDNHNELGQTWLLHAVDLELRGLREIPIPATSISRHVQDYWVRHTIFYFDSGGDLKKTALTVEGAIALADTEQSGVTNSIDQQPCEPAAAFDANALIAGIRLTQDEAPVSGLEGASNPLFFDADTFELLWRRNNETYTPPGYC